MSTDHDIVQHRHGAEQGKVLKGAADADIGNLVRRCIQDGLPVEANIAGIGDIKAAETVEQGCLTGPVGTDQAQNGPLLNIKTDTVERDNTAEMYGDIADLQQWLSGG